MMKKCADCDTEFDSTTTQGTYCMKCESPESNLAYYKRQFEMMMHPSSQKFVEKINENGLDKK